MTSFHAELFLPMCVSKGRNYANDRILEEWFRNSIFDDKIGLKICDGSFVTAIGDILKISPMTVTKEFLDRVHCYHSHH